MGSERDDILRIGFGGTLFRHRPGIDDRRGLLTTLREWVWWYKPDFFIPTSRAGYFLFRGIQAFKAKYPELSGRLRVEIWGNIDPENQKQAEAMGIGDIVRIEGYRERKDSRAKLDACDVLFLPLELAKPGYRPMLIPGKVFEYLQTGKPALTIGQKSDALDIMRRSGLGIAHEAMDSAGIAESLRGLILEKDRLGEIYVPDRAYIAQFDFRNLSARLAGIFEELAGG